MTNEQKIALGLVKKLDEAVDVVHTTSYINKRVSKHIDLDFSQTNVSKEIVNYAFELVKSYDLYTGAIDDGAQCRDANRRNKITLKELKNIGVKTIIWKDYTPIMSTRIFDKILNLDEIS